MSPLSEFLVQLRKSRGLRQLDFVNWIGCKQSYVSSMESGRKGPPPDLHKRLTQAFGLSQEDQAYLNLAIEASNRELVINGDSPRELYELLNDLRGEISNLDPKKIRAIRAIIDLNR